METIDKVMTQWGIINGRDAIFLDKVIETFSPHKLYLLGEVNGRLCSNGLDDREFIPYKITFVDVLMHECIQTDYCEYEVDLLSNFDEVRNSHLLEKFPKGYRHFRFATYDYIFQIVATQYVLEFS